jgi:acyl-coenzyme A thioesterase PaaI-like protein
VKLLRELRAEGRQQDMGALVARIPYARFLGIQVDRKGTELTTILPFRQELVGNVTLPALHGGAIGAFLEFTAVIQLLFDDECVRLPKTVDISIDYLRSGRPVTTYGRAFITKHGRRVANVRAEAWQEEHDRPIAIAHGHFLLDPVDEDG